MPRRKTSKRSTTRKRKAPARRRTTRKTRKANRRAPTNKLFVKAKATADTAIVGPLTAEYMCAATTPMNTMFGSADILAAPPADGAGESVHQYQLTARISFLADATGSSFYASANPLVGPMFDKYDSFYFRNPDSTSQDVIGDWFMGYCIRWSKVPDAVAAYREITQFVKSVGGDRPDVTLQGYFPRCGVAGLCPTNVQGGPPQGQWLATLYKPRLQDPLPNAQSDLDYTNTTFPKKNDFKSYAKKNVSVDSFLNPFIESVYLNRRNMITEAGATKNTIPGLGNLMYTTSASPQQQQWTGRAAEGIHVRNAEPDALTALVPVYFTPSQWFWSDPSYPVGSKRVFPSNVQNVPDLVLRTFGKDGGIKYFATADDQGDPVLPYDYQGNPIFTTTHSTATVDETRAVAAPTPMQAWDRGIFLAMTGASSDVPQTMDLSWCAMGWVKKMNDAMYSVHQEGLPPGLAPSLFVEHLQNHPWVTPAHSFWGGLKHMFEAPFKLIKSGVSHVVHFVEHPHVEKVVKGIGEAAQTLQSAAQQYGPAFAQMGAMAG